MPKPVEQSFGTFTLRIGKGDDGKPVLERREARARTWTPTTKAKLRDEHEAGSEVWTWLKANGVARPSPGGTVWTDEQYADGGLQRLFVRVPQATLDGLDAIAARDGLSGRAKAITAAVEAALGAPSDIAAKK
jgi:hypothetical protein